MAFSSVLPIQNRNGSQQTAARVLPAQVQGATLRLDRDTGDVWSAGEVVAVFIDVSWDGGTTWVRTAAGSFAGPLPATGKGGVGTYQALVGAGVPLDPQGERPTHYRAGFVVTGGPVRFGVSLEAS